MTLPPDEAALEQAIRHIGDAVPAPDPARLTAILREVERGAPTRAKAYRPAWLPWLLLGLAATAAAAGWLGHTLRTGTATEPQPTPAAHEPADVGTAGAATPPHSAQPAGQNGKGGASTPRRNPVIYMR